MDNAKSIAERAIRRSFGGTKRDYSYMKTAIKDELARYIYAQTKRRPMILPIIMEL